MFNLSGSEIVFLLLIALIVLGPEKLPEAVRKFGKAYQELKKMSTGFQSELKEALDEPMREMRETAEAFKSAANFNFDVEPDEPAEIAPAGQVVAEAQVVPEAQVAPVAVPVASNEPPLSSGEEQHVADQREAIDATIAARADAAETDDETATE
jgi:sec-independent protein translocase protein TatB